MIYAVPTNTPSLDLFSLVTKQVWNYTVLGDCIRDEKGDRVRTAGVKY